jgi:hypothetical protein
VLCMVPYTVLCAKLALSPCYHEISPHSNTATRQRRPKTEKLTREHHLPVRSLLRNGSINMRVRCLIVRLPRAVWRGLVLELPHESDSSLRTWFRNSM